MLKVACNEEDWSPDDMQRAYRAGNADSTQPRMIIVTFRYSDDKYRIYDGREKLRENGIRVSDDLTTTTKTKGSETERVTLTKARFIHVRNRRNLDQIVPLIR